LVPRLGLVLDDRRELDLAGADTLRVRDILRGGTKSEDREGVQESE